MNGLIEEQWKGEVRWWRKQGRGMEMERERERDGMGGTEEHAECSSQQSRLSQSDCFILIMIINTLEISYIPISIIRNIQYHPR